MSDDVGIRHPTGAKASGLGHSAWSPSPAWSLWASGSAAQRNENPSPRLRRGLVVWSLGSFLSRGRGLPAGPLGLLGLSEGVGYLAARVPDPMTEPHMPRIPHMPLPRIPHMPQMPRKQCHEKKEGSERLRSEALGLVLATLASGLRSGQVHE